MNSRNSIANPKLVKIIRNLQSANRAEFISELFGAKFLCPTILGEGTALENHAKNKILSEDSAVQLIGLNAATGKTYLMAFTDWGELSKWNKSSDYKNLIFTYADYQRIILQGDSVYEGFVINPFNENIVLSKSFIFDVSQNYQQVKKGESVMLGVPKDYPYDMEEALKFFFSNAKTVQRAYLLWMINGKEASYLLVLDVTDLMQNVISEVSEICQPYLDGKLLNIISADTALGKDAITRSKAFFHI